MLQLTRRQLGLLSLGGLWSPRRLLAAPSAGERKFLFLHCEGGWDTSYAFTPLFDSPIADTEEDAEEASVGGIRFVDSPHRPSVRAFFEGYADRCCLLNGLEVRSVTHERCLQLMLTGSGGGGADDWPSALGAASSEANTMPHLVLDGPAFSERHSSQVVRIGDRGQLQTLLTGDALKNSDQRVEAPPADVSALSDAFLLERLGHLQGQASLGRAAELTAAYAESTARRLELEAYQDVLQLVPSEEDCERDLVVDAATAFDCFELGLSRCAMMRYKGWCSEGWDTHHNLELQSTNFEDLFAYLNHVMLELDGRVTLSGTPLADEVTIVVFSEMGRAPALNSWGGKDHWTFNSTLLIGGVPGGRVIGALDGDALGRPVDLASGDVTDGGTPLLPDHLGATLLALGDVDPGEYTDASPIEALL